MEEEMKEWKEMDEELEEDRDILKGEMEKLKFS